MIYYVLQHQEVGWDTELSGRRTRNEESKWGKAVWDEQKLINGKHKTG
jgi:hypothetical protein